MERIDQGLEFLNYENVCQAEKEILQNILQGSDSKEYSKGLFAFETPFSEKITEEVALEIGQGESQFFTESDETTINTSQSSSHEIAEVSAQQNGAILSFPPVPQHVPTVSQTGPMHGISNYYPGQAQLPVAVSATSAPISSVGPAPINNPPSNQMLMFAPGMSPMIPQQSYYPPPPYYGPQGGNPQHMSFLPIDNSDGGYMPVHSQGQNHHKLHHETHHTGGPPPNASGQPGNSYGKPRRKQQQPPSYYYQPNYYQQVPYYNQQQLQNVTGPPIIMGPGMYLPHHPGMYQGPPGNDIEHHPGSQSMVPIPNDMSFAQHQYPGPQVYSHNSPRNYNPHSINRGTGASQQSDISVVSEVRVVDKQSPTGNNDASTSSQTPKSLPDLSNSNGTIASSPEKEAGGSSAEESQNPIPGSMNIKTVVSDASTIVNGDISSLSLADLPSKKPEKPDTTAEKIIPPKTVHSTTKVDVVPLKQANGEIDTDCSENKSSRNRDNTSADHKSKSDVAIEPNTTAKSSKSTPDVAKSLGGNVSQNNNSSSSRSVSTTAIVKTDQKTNEISTVTVEVSKSSSSVSVQNEPKPQVAGRSWASIASVKSQNIPNNGAATNTRNNHTPPNPNSDEQSSSSVSGVTTKTSGSSNVPSFTENRDGQGHSEPILDWDRVVDENDPVAWRLGEHLAKYVLDHQSIPLAPRGLYNHSNSCFLNAILQALLACPPFVNIFRSMSYISDKTPCKSAPVTQNVFEFIREFTPLIRSNATKKDKMRDSFNPGPNLEPSGIRKSLALLSKDTFKVEGRQEDAEEFLSFLLNCLHEEMIKMMKLSDKKMGVEVIEKIPDTTVNGEGEDIKEDDDDWQVMGAKNRSCLTRRTAITKSPISEAFLGQMCLSLSRVNSVKKAHLEPFFTLQLAIQNDNIKSVKDALEAISIKEEVSGMISATGGEVEAWRHISLEELPPILILHLKRFVFEKNGIQKNNKKLEYGVDLEIGKDLLSNNSKSRYTLKQRQYKLFAVVYHDGEDAHKGHYVADCFHPSGGSMWGQWGWLRYDDTCVKPVSEATMLNPQHPRVPYLLLYRRQDTIVQQQLKKGS